MAGKKIYEKKSIGEQVADKKENVKKSVKSALTERQEYEIIIKHVNGSTRTELAEEYKVSEGRIEKLIKSPIYKQVIKDRAKAIAKVTRRAFSRHDLDFMAMVDMYFKQAMDPKVVKKSGLGTLFGVLETVSRRFENIERAEIENRKAKIELLRLATELKYMKKQVIEAEAEEIEGTERKQEPSIIGNFIKELRQQATPDLDKRREDEPVEGKQE